jgi:hypothetical protein
MWLINTTTLNLEYFQVVGQNRYAILSHRWEEDEITFQDMQSKIDVEKKQGYKKVLICCDLAQQDGLEYAWVDTCW